MPTISVCVICYNHSKYILECLKSIAAQQCSFTFEVVICDDASNDKTDEVVDSFIKLNKLLNFKLYRAENNQGMMKNFLKAISLCKGKYIAFCEGDDYWVDALKLHKQVTAMIDNPSCSLSVHPSYLHRSTNKFKSIGFYKGDNIKKFEIADVLRNAGQSSPTASYMVSRNAIEMLPPWIVEAPVADIFIELFSLKAGSGLYIPDVMCVYRLDSQNSWSSMMKNNAAKRLIRHGNEMLKYLQIMEQDELFSGDDFSVLKSSSLLSVAIGNLLNNDYELFNINIIRSFTISNNSTKTQKWLYAFRDKPKIACNLFKLRQFLDRWRPVYKN